MSLPVRGAWIEMADTDDVVIEVFPSLPVRGAWIEMPSRSSPCTAPATSLPVRGAWIEIMRIIGEDPGAIVAPRAGSVD